MKTIGLQSSSPIVVSRLIRRVHGGSQAAIVQCEDGRFYTLKLNGSPQGPNVLANELLGSRLGRSVGLPMAETRFLSVKQDFLDTNPSIRFETQASTYKPEAGLHLGSLLVGEVAGPNRALEWIGPSDVSRIGNLRDFLGMYLFDVWAMHQDQRQALFIRHPRNRLLYGTFVDNGHVCGGPRWEDTGRKFIACHFQKTLYSGLWSTSEVQAWTRTLQRVIPQELSSASAFIPTHWYSGDLNALCDRLLRRLSALPTLFEAHSLDMYAPSPRSSHPSPVGSYARTTPSI